MKGAEMINNNMKIGQKVMFSAAVVKQCGHEKTVADMRGEIVFSARANKNVVAVDTGGTYPNEEGNPIRHIPIKNLVVVTP
jgi:hypothetical protein